MTSWELLSLSVLNLGQTQRHRWSSAACQQYQRNGRIRVWLRVQTKCQTTTFGWVSTREMHPAIEEKKHHQNWHDREDRRVTRVKVEWKWDIYIPNYEKCKVRYWLWDLNSITLKSWSFPFAWYLFCFSTCFIQDNPLKVNITCFKTSKSIVLSSTNCSQYDLHAKVCHSHSQHQPTLHRKESKRLFILIFLNLYFINQLLPNLSWFSNPRFVDVLRETSS